MHYGRCASDESSYLDRTSLVNKVFILLPNYRVSDAQRFVLLLFSILRVGRPPRHWFISFSRLPFPASFASTLNVPMVFLIFFCSQPHEQLTVKATDEGNHFRFPKPVLLFKTVLKLTAPWLAQFRERRSAHTVHSRLLTEYSLGMSIQYT